MSSRTADIAAAPERVWSLLVDPAERLRWVDELVATVPDRPPSGVGDEFVLKIREGGNVVDYSGEGQVRASAVQVVAQANPGSIHDAEILENPEIKGLRLKFDLDPEGSDVVELRLELRSGERRIAETWVYRWSN